MSSIARWSYTSTLTIWPKDGVDEWGQPSYSNPYTVQGSWEMGGDAQIDDQGAQWMPQSTYYFEAEDGSELIPERGWFIKRGNHTGSLPDDAEKIRHVGGWDMSMFGNEIPDWVIRT